MSSTTVPCTSPSATSSGEQYKRRSRSNVCDVCDVPALMYDCAAPSETWSRSPDFYVDACNVHPTPLPELPDNSEWSDYPWRLPGNEAHGRPGAGKSQMSALCSDCELSTVYKVSIFEDGSFEKQVEPHTVRKDNDVDLRAYWHHLGAPPPPNVRVQALFVADMTLPVLQMLGTRYNIDPFFFASSANLIPSRYQGGRKALEDHITVVVPFVYVLKNQRPITRSKTPRVPAEFASTEPRSWGVDEPPLYTEERQSTDAQAPLSLPGNKALFQDSLSLHIVRNTTTSAIISCHPSLQGTSAKRLQSLVQRMGDGVYWSRIFRSSKDPTLLFLAILWYPVYAWDEALDVLFRLINDFGEPELNDVKLTQELHKLRAHISPYKQLLQNFLRSVEFVRDTPNPAMNAPSISKVERDDSAKLLHTEADALISEIRRLARKREMLSARLDNVTHLTFATVNLESHKAKRVLVEATLKKSAALRQITYLSMVFLSATYLATVFGMNVHQMKSSNTFTCYTVAVVLTWFASWIVIALRKGSFYSRDGVLCQILWPWSYARGVISTKFKWSFESADRPYVSGEHA